MITRFIVLNDYKGRVNLSSLLAFWHEVVSIINSLPLTSQYLNDPKNVEALSHYHVFFTKRDSQTLPFPGNFAKEVYAQKRWR